MTLSGEAQQELLERVQDARRSLSNRTSSLEERINAKIASAKANYVPSTPLGNMMERRAQYSRSQLAK